jgi:signal transduction histidine kinase
MLLKYDLGEEKQLEYAKMSLEAAGELEKMTSNVSSFLSLGHTVDNNATASLKELFEKSKRHYEAYATALGHCFIATWEGNDAVFPIQPLQLERMLYNLLDNAFKYSPSGGKVHLFCRVDKKKAEIQIADNGIGMEQEQFQQIFTPFYRGQTARTENGLGLGLSVVKGIVEELNGTIQLKSQREKGSTFTVILPLS